MTFLLYVDKYCFQKDPICVYVLIDELIVFGEIKLKDKILLFRTYRTGGQAKYTIHIHQLGKLHQIISKKIA